MSGLLSKLAKLTTGQYILLCLGCTVIPMVVPYKAGQLYALEGRDSGCYLIKCREERLNYWRSKVENVKKIIQHKPVGDGTEE